MIWFIRKWFWNFLGWVKITLNKPLDIPLPPETRRSIVPVPLGSAIPAIPIKGILVCPPDQIPPDERSRSKTLVYKLQVWLYDAFSPMQAGLPPVDADGERALKNAFTWLHRTRFNPPEMPAEYLGSPDLGSLAVRGPYACYTERCEDGSYQWDLMQLAQYAHHEGLHKLGAKVLFRIDPTRRALQAYRIDTTLGCAEPGDAGWERAKKIALASATTHLSLVRHFNGVHLIGGAYLAIATRNQLPPTHPLCRLLWPYMFGTLQSNDIVTRGQMARGGEFETIFSFTFEGMCQLYEDSWHDYRVIVNDPHDDARARQVLAQGFDTPTEDNLRALFEPMHAFARNYLQIYYPESGPGGATRAIRNDASVLAWLDELNALLPHGVDVSRADVTFDNLARLLARWIYLVTVQHEILGSFVWNYQLWTQRQPVRVYQNGQREPLDVYQRLVNANYNLNVTRRALMHDFSYMALDAPAKAAMEKFTRDLTALQARMEAEPRAVWKMYPKTLKVNINA